MRSGKSSEVGFSCRGHHGNRGMCSARGFPSSYSPWSAATAPRYGDPEDKIEQTERPIPKRVGLRVSCDAIFPSLDRIYDTKA